MSNDNKEKTRSPAAGFDTRPENINRNGRPPKGYSITDTVRAMLARSPEVKERLTQKIKEKALAGDMKAIELLWSYMDGKPVQTSNVHLQESPEDKVKNTLELLKGNGVLQSGSGHVLQDEGGPAISSDEGSE